MLIDFHVHSNNSFDSKDTIYNICETAILKGITDICFTEHFSIDERRKSYGFLEYSKYYNEIEQAREIYKENLNIYGGLELCEPHISIKEYESALSEFQLDFILGSVHNIGSVGLTNFALQNSSKDSYETYFNELYKMVCYGEFNVAAHLDLMNRYAIGIHGDYKFIDFKEIIYEILKKLIERGKGIEINTSGLRNSLNNLHPKIEILKLYKELGGEIITIGSDAHKLLDVGAGCREALELIKTLGYKYIFTFEKLSPKAHIIK